MGACSYKGLRYICPANGGWGMVRIAMMVPESHQLFISPAACGRHGALGAVQHGIKERLSYYYVDERDVIAGYDEKILEGAEELLGWLERRGRHPRVITLFVTCIDDLIGTDTGALAEELEARHPGIYFHVCHMNPITEEMKEPPMVSIHKSIFSLLGREGLPPKDGGINCIGNLEPLAGDCELSSLLALMGCGPLRHISQFDTFEGFLSMASSQCNLVLFPSAQAAAGELERRLGTPWQPLYMTADLPSLRRQYEELGHLLEKLTGRELPQEYGQLMTSWEERVEKAARDTRECLGDCRIALDDFSHTNPFGLALFLRARGLNVAWIVYREAAGQAAEDKRRVEEKYPDIELICSIDYGLPRMLSEAGAAAAKGGEESSKCRQGTGGELLAVGVEAAYILNADYVVNLFWDQGQHGYRGLERLLELMRREYGNRADIRGLIEGHGLVV